jgi:hypothetical protein
MRPKNDVAHREHRPERKDRSAHSGVPPRVADRPDPLQWDESELMTLQEAAALFWPSGPLTTTSLRAAVRDGKLEVAEIAGKLLTNKLEIAKMTRCAVRASQQGAWHHAATVTERLPQTVAELRRLLSEGKL